ncbi:hypothetical protein NM2005040_1608 [Neisseria meningitidis 2005040]|nr:hypothetical protein NM2005040_1608 [Neisseria meningitidis 2005040]
MRGETVIASTIRQDERKRKKHTWLIGEVSAKPGVISAVIMPVGFAYLGFRIGTGGKIIGIQFPQRLHCRIERAVRQRVNIAAHHSKTLFRRLTANLVAPVCPSSAPEPSATPFQKNPADGGVTFQLEIFKLEGKQIFDFRIDFHHWQGARFAFQLQCGLLEMVAVQMRVAKRMDTIRTLAPSSWSTMRSWQY